MVLIKRFRIITKYSVLRGGVVCTRSTVKPKYVSTRVENPSINLVTNAQYTDIRYYATVIHLTHTRRTYGEYIIITVLDVTVRLPFVVGPMYEI